MRVRPTAPARRARRGDAPGGHGRPTSGLGSSHGLARLERPEPSARGPATAIGERSPARTLAAHDVGPSRRTSSPSPEVRRNGQSPPTTTQAYALGRRFAWRCARSGRRAAIPPGARPRTASRALTSPAGDRGNVAPIRGHRSAEQVQAERPERGEDRQITATRDRSRRTRRRPTTAPHATRTSLSRRSALAAPAARRRAEAQSRDRARRRADCAERSCRCRSRSRRCRATAPSSAPRRYATRLAEPSADLRRSRRRRRRARSNAAAQENELATPGSDRGGSSATTGSASPNVRRRLRSGPQAGAATAGFTPSRAARVSAARDAPDQRTEPDASQDGRAALREVEAIDQ